MTDYYQTMASPLGKITICGNRAGIHGIYLPQHAAVKQIQTTYQVSTNYFDSAKEQLQRYFLGEVFTFDLPLKQTGTAFQNSVWQSLCDIPRGQTQTYADICRTIGKPRAFQAVGSANGANKIAIVVPCHRVIGSDGGLSGYAGGIEAKAWLLRHEKALI